MPSPDLPKIATSCRQLAPMRRRPPRSFERTRNEAPDGFRPRGLVGLARAPSVQLVELIRLKADADKRPFAGRSRAASFLCYQGLRHHRKCVITITDRGEVAASAPALNRNGSFGDHVMACAPYSTSRNLARINPSWTPAIGDLGPLAKFFDRGAASSPLPAATPRPSRPVTGAALELA